MATTDHEVSTFQKRPAYRYIRAADRLPSTAEARAAEDPMLVVKLFDPTGSASWYIAGYDPSTRNATGVAHLHEIEAGDFSMAELVALRGRFGLPLERDLYWSPTPMSEVLAGRVA
jgi:hypothetical protein